MDLTTRLNIFINNDQAKKALFELEKNFNANTKALNNLENAGKGQTEEVEKLRVANQKLSEDMAKQKQQIGITSLTYKELRAQYSALLKDYNRSIPGSSERKKLEKELMDVKNRMVEVRFNGNRCQNTFEKLSTGIQKYWGAIGAIGAALSGIGLGFKTVGDQISDFEKTFTNVLTLLSDTDKIKYKIELEKGSIEIMKKYGTTITDTNKAMFDAVSAGVPAGEAIQFLDEAAILAVGGVTSLGVAVDGTTSVLNAYGLEASEANKVTAAFFSAQKAGKTTVEELATNIGKLAPTAASVGIGFQEVLSVMSVLTTKGIKTAEATTQIKAALSGLLKPGKEAEEVLRQYGVPVGATEIKAAGLTNTLAALNSMYEQNADALSKAIPSVEGYNAIAALSGETLNTYSEVLQQVNTDYGTNSSLAKAYAEQMQTIEMRAKTAKAELTTYVLGNETLKNAYLNIILVCNGLLKVLVALLKFTMEYGKGIVWLGGIMTMYIIGAKAQIIWNKLISLSLIDLSKAWIVVRNSMLKFTATLLASPWGLALAGITALIGVVKLFTIATKEYNAEAVVNARVQKKANEGYVEEKNNIEQLYKSLNNSNLSLDKRREALKKLQELVPEYHGSLTNEGKLIGDNTIVLDNYIDKLKEKALAEAYASEQADLVKKKNDIQYQINEATKKLNKPKGIFGEIFTNSSLKGDIMKFLDEIKNVNKELDVVDKKIKTAIEKGDLGVDGSSISTQTTTTTTTPTNDQDPDAAFKKQEKLLNDSLSRQKLAIEQAYADLHITKEQYDTQMSNAEGEHLNSLLALQRKYGQDSTATAIKIAQDKQKQNEKSAKESEEQIEAEHKKSVENIKKGYINGEYSHDIYLQKIEDAEILHLQALINYRKQYGQDVSDLEVTLANKQIEILKKKEDEMRAEQDETDAKNEAISKEWQNKAERIKLDQELNSSTKIRKARLADIETMEKKLLLSEAEAAKERGNIWMDDIGAKAQIAQQYLGLAQGFVDEMMAAENAKIDAQHNEELGKLDSYYSAQIDAAAGNEEEQQRLREEYAQKKQQLEYQTAVKKLEVEKKAADAQFAIGVGQAIAGAALSIVQCFAQLGPIGGAIAAGMVGATTAMQIMAMKAQRDAIKSKTIENPGLASASGSGSSSSTTSVGRTLTSEQKTQYEKGFADGGYTQVERAQDGAMYNAKIDHHKRGFVDRPTLLVGEEGGEFVANAQAVKNPKLRPIFNILDMAQKNGTIGRLNIDVIAGSLYSRRVKGYAAGGFTGVENPNKIYGDTSELMSVMLALSNSLNVLNNRLDKDFKAYLVYSEMEAQINRYNQTKTAAKI